MKRAIWFCEYVKMFNAFCECVKMFNAFNVIMVLKVKNGIFYFGVLQWMVIAIEYLSGLLAMLTNNGNVMSCLRILTGLRISVESRKLTVYI